LAQALRIPRVIVPAYPGALSALGILISDVVKDHSRTVLLRVGPEARSGENNPPPFPQKQLDAIFAELQREIATELKKEQWQGRAVWEPSCDVRYRGQGYELNLPYDAGVLRRFHAEHKRRYGYSSPEREVEIVTVRLRGRVASPERLERLKIHAEEDRLRQATTSVYFGGERHKAQVLPRGLVRPGKKYRGPAIITEYSATTVAPPGFRFMADKAESLLVEVD
jgi:N-methylhydantoinase A